MNGAPHVHELIVQEYHDDRWFIKYGDQVRIISKPIFRPKAREAGALRKAIAKIIHAHDIESAKALERDKRKLAAKARAQVIVAEVVPKLVDGRWGSSQL